MRFRVLAIATLLLAQLGLASPAHAQRTELAADAFGYTARACLHQPVVLGGAAQPVLAGSADDTTATVALAEPFSWYGFTVTDVQVSDNGYLAFGSDDGADFSPDFPLPAIPSNIDAASQRLYVAHADWQLDAQSEVSTAFFAACPRAEQGQTPSCTVIDWHDVLPSGRTTPRAHFQVVLYHGSGQAVVQHIQLPQVTDQALTVGVQDIDQNSGLASHGDERRPASGESTCWSTQGEPPLIQVTVTADPPEGGTATGSTAVPEGTPVTVTATPAEFYDFVGWYEPEADFPVSQSLDYTFNATVDTVLIARFSQQTYYIYAEASPLEAATINGADLIYTHGQQVELSFDADPDYQFLGWFEDDVLVESSPTWSFEATEDLNLEARFALIVPYTVTTIISPDAQAGTVTGAGTYTSGSTATLVATPSAGYRFVRWSNQGIDISTSPTLVFTVTSDRTLTAEFALLEYTITAQAMPAQGGTIAGAGTYTQGTAISLVATPVAGYRFVRWTEQGTPVGTAPTLAFTVTEDRSLVAEFALEDVPLFLLVTPAESGTVTGAGFYAPGSTVTITATPAAGFAFVRWVDGSEVLSFEPSVDVVVDSARTLEAQFEVRSMALFSDGFE